MLFVFDEVDCGRWTRGLMFSFHFLCLLCLPALIRPKVTPHNRTHRQTDETKHINRMKFPSHASTKYSTCILEYIVKCLNSYGKPNFLSMEMKEDHIVFTLFQNKSGFYNKRMYKITYENEEEKNTNRPLFCSMLAQTQRQTCTFHCTQHNICILAAHRANSDNERQWKNWCSSKNQRWA